MNNIRNIAQSADDATSSALRELFDMKLEDKGMALFNCLNCTHCEYDEKIENYRCWSDWRYQYEIKDPVNDEIDSCWKHK